jgi:hypothetical protein
VTLSRGAANSKRISFVVTFVSVTIQEVSFRECLRNDHWTNGAKLRFKLNAELLIHQLVSKFTAQRNQVGSIRLGRKVCLARAQPFSVCLKDDITPVSEFVNGSEDCLFWVNVGIDLQGSLAVAGDRNRAGHIRGLDFPDSGYSCTMLFAIRLVPSVEVFHVTRTFWPTRNGSLPAYALKSCEVPNWDVYLVSLTKLNCSMDVSDALTTIVFAVVSIFVIVPLKTSDGAASLIRLPVEMGGLGVVGAATDGLGAGAGTLGAEGAVLPETCDAWEAWEAWEPCCATRE